MGRKKVFAIKARNLGPLSAARLGSSSFQLPASCSGDELAVAAAFFDGAAGQSLSFSLQ